jgi:uncharacterized lipoprotein YajG
MKRLALVAAVFALAGCAGDRDTELTDTTTPTMAPAPAPIMTDTMGMMGMDTLGRDTLMRDTMMVPPVRP